MKIVKNTCYGGFSLSPLATKRLMELKGKECHFFETNVSSGVVGQYVPITLEEAEKRGLFWTAFTVPDPANHLPKESIGVDGTYAAFNEAYKKIDAEPRPSERTDPHLVQVVEELGDRANGACAKLEIVDIPDGVEYEIDEYDGVETIREKHRSW